MHKTHGTHHKGGRKATEAAGRCLPAGRRPAAVSQPGRGLRRQRSRSPLVVCGGGGAGLAARSWPAAAAAAALVAACGGLGLAARSSCGGAGGLAALSQFQYRLRPCSKELTASSKDWFVACGGGGGGLAARS